MKVKIYADPHITKYPPGLASVKQEELLALFEELNQDDGSSLHICLGDFFHHSQILAKDVSYILKLVKSITTPTIILTGNHDRSSLDDSIVKLIQEMNPKITVVDTYLIDHEMAMCSHGYLKEMIAKEDLSGVKYIFTHEDFKDVILNSSGRKSTSGYNPSSLSNFLVFNGHIHKFSDDHGFLCNVGSIAPVAFGELSSTDIPGYVLLDTLTGTWTFHSVSRGLIPWTWRVTETERPIRTPAPYRGKVRLRIEYEGDQPSYDLSCFDKSVVSLEYKKILSKPLGVEDVESVDVEDVVVQVPDSVEKLVKGDTTITEDMQVSVLEASAKILQKVGL